MSSSVSHWLDQVSPLPARPALEGDAAYDVVIVGAGFTGLWAAWHLLDRDPSLSIAIVEAEHVGFGASGRNGGWCTSGLAMGPSALKRRFGEDAARRVVDTMRSAVDAIGDTGIDCDFRKNGNLLLARGSAQVPEIAEHIEDYESVGRSDGLEALDKSAARARVKATRVEGAVFDPHAATIQPAKLALGLAANLEARGVRIYERSPVRSIAARSGAEPASIDAPAGRAEAGAILVCTEAWLAGMRPFRRMLPVYSLIVVTEPLTAEQWESVGWHRGENLASFQMTVDYLSKTADGRILFGGRGAPYHYGSRIRPEFDHHDPTHDKLRAAVVDWWPQLRGIEFASAWGGPLGIPRDFTLNLGFDRASGIGGAYGYVGQGVAATYVSGSYLAAGVTDALDTLPPLPFFGHTSRRWEPEPLRWLGARFVQRSFAALDRKAERTGRGPDGTSIAERLYSH